jgi:hypothetical protein
VIFPALSIRQPHAEEILLGIKVTESRRWLTRYRGPLLIHASKQLDSVDLYQAQTLIETINRRGGNPIRSLSELPRGGIIGIVDLVDVVRDYASHCAVEGLYHWVLRNPRRIPFTPMSGRLGLFRVEVKEAFDGALACSPA